MVITLAAGGAANVELESYGRAHGIDGSCNRAVRKNRASQIGVKDSARQIEDAPQARDILLLQECQRAVSDRAGIAGGPCTSSAGLTRRPDGPTNGTDGRRVPKTRDRSHPRPSTQDPGLPKEV